MTTGGEEKRGRRRLVLDTNSLVSRLLLPEPLPGRAVSHAMRVGQVLSSEESLEELKRVLSRAKFDRYISLEDRQQFIRLFMRTAVPVPIVRHIQACRDKRDDCFLELAVNGNAELIISGDEDLLVLHPFERISILSPRAFLETEGLL